MVSNACQMYSQSYSTRCVHRSPQSCQVLTRRKGIRVSETQEFRGAFRTFSVSRQALNRIDVTIKAYKGGSRSPRWIDSEPGHRAFHRSPHNFSHTLSVGSFFDLCTVAADTSAIPKPKIKNPRGIHHEVSFEVVLLFGLTELKAQLLWKEHGVEKRWVHLPPSLTKFAKGKQGTSQNNIRPGRGDYRDIALNHPSGFVLRKINISESRSIE